MVESYTVYNKSVISKVQQIYPDTRKFTPVKVHNNTSNLYPLVISSKTQVAFLIASEYYVHLVVRCTVWINPIFISRRAREGDYEMMPVCVCVCVSVSHRFLQNYYSYRFFCKLIVPMNFHTLEIFFWFYGRRPEDK